MQTSLEVQRTIKRAESWAVGMAMCKCGPSDIFLDIRGFVQALNESEVDCISAGHNDADIWVFVWSKIDECIDEGPNIGVVWTKAQTTLEEEATMTLVNRHVAW